MLTDGAFYRELGADHWTVRKPAKAKAREVSQLEALGYTVTLKPLARPYNQGHAVDQCHPLAVTLVFVSVRPPR